MTGLQSTKRLAVTAAAALALTTLSGMALADTTLTIESWRNDDADSRWRSPRPSPTRPTVAPPKERVKPAPSPGLIAHVLVGVRRLLNERRRTVVGFPASHTRISDT